MAALGDIKIRCSRLDADRAILEFAVKVDTKLKAIKARIEMETQVPPEEQRVIFRGRPLTDEEAEPLNSEDLADIVSQAGEEGLRMAFVHIKPMLNAFLEQEGMVDPTGDFDINAKKKTGATALHRAARANQTYVVEELLACEAFKCVDERDRQGQTALHTATSCQYVEVIKTILSSPRFTLAAACDWDGKTALHMAAHWGDAEICKAILDNAYFNQEDCHHKDKCGYTAHEYATLCGHVEAAAAIAAVIGVGAIAESTVTDGRGGAAAAAMDATAPRE